MWLFWGADPLSPRQLDGDVFVELDVGSEGNGDEVQLGGVLRDLLAGGSIASYLTSPHGFQFRRLGAGEPGGRLGGEPEGVLRCSGAVWGGGAQSTTSQPLLLCWLSRPGVCQPLTKLGWGGVLG